MQIQVTDQDKRAATLTHPTGPSEQDALWQCVHCGVWWCSQPERRPTSFVLALPANVLEGLGWDNFRGWRLGATPNINTCPDCGTIAQSPSMAKALGKL